MLPSMDNPIHGEIFATAAPARNSFLASAPANSQHANRAKPKQRRPRENSGQKFKRITLLSQLPPCSARSASRHSHRVAESASSAGARAVPGSQRVWHRQDAPTDSPSSGLSDRLRARDG